MRVEIKTTMIYEIFEDGKVELVEQKVEQKQIYSEAEYIIKNHMINISEKRYGIFTFSSKEELSKVLPQGVDITVLCNGNKYKAHTHASKKGRVDRLTDFMEKENIHVRTILNAKYDIGKRILYVEKKNQ